MILIIMTIYTHCAARVNTETLHVELISEKQALEQHYDEVINHYVLKELKKPEFRENIIQNNIALTKKAIADSVSQEHFIIQTINSIEELDRICNGLSKRAREWYGYYFPEATERISDNELFVREVLQKDKGLLTKELNIKFSMGPDVGHNGIEKQDIEKVTEFVMQIRSLYDERESLKNYLEILMKKICPNTYAVAGSLIGAKLLEKAGSLKHLSIMPSSTIQLLGAEKALFRHLRNKKIRPPKHGLILSHPYVMDAKDKGKAARMFSAKISIASKVDYFKGEFIGDKLKEEL